MRDIPEADWKYMRALKDTLVNRLCGRINARISAMIADPTRTNHERFLDIFSAIAEENDNVARAFDDWRRSTIFERIAEIRRQGLFESGELAGLTEQTRERLATYMEIFLPAGRSGGTHGEQVDPPPSKPHGD